MKHKEKKLRKAAKRISTTGTIGEMNLTDRDVLIVTSILNFFYVRAPGQFSRDMHFFNFEDKMETLTQEELKEVSSKFRRLRDYLLLIYNKTPEEIARINIERQEANEEKQKQQKLPLGPHVAKSDDQLVEEAINAHASAQ